MAYFGIADPQFDDTNCLACPNCGELYLHHETIATIRRGEDNPKHDTVVVTCLDGCKAYENDQYSVSSGTNVLVPKNPSPRRGSIVTQFYCESCDAKPQLAIIQHKGCTYLEWIDLGLPEPEPIKRKPIKPSLRFEILKRDDYRCQMCGVTAKDGATLEIDHITPVSKGGTNDADNLQVLCRDCNAGKSDSWQ